MDEKAWASGDNLSPVLIGGLNERYKVRMRQASCEAAR